MYLRDRLANVTLIAAALAAWAAVALLFTTRSPFDAAGQGDAPVQLAGALLLGLAVALTLWPPLLAHGIRPAAPHRAPRRLDPCCTARSPWSASWWCCSS